jgi:DNA-binding LacI/PurR family transcriptional regulator
VANAFHAELVEAIQDAADDAGYQLVLSPVTRSHDEDRAVETLLEFRCEALLLLGPTTSDPELTALAGQLPVVVVGRPPGVPGPDVVRTDDADGLSQVVHHLVGLGHRRIAHLAGGPTAIAALRVQGYTSAMTRCGLAGQIDILSGGHTEAAGLQAAEQLLARPPTERPTAVATFNDHSATGLLERLVRAGIDVPREISVVGYDDSALARLAHLDLTTVSQEPREQARLAVAAAVEQLDGGRIGPRESVLTPRLVIRGTTAPPPMTSGGRS